MICHGNQIKNNEYITHPMHHTSNRVNANVAVQKQRVLKHLELLSNQQTIIMSATAPAVGVTFFKQIILLPDTSFWCHTLLDSGPDAIDDNLDDLNAAMNIKAHVCHQIQQPYISVDML